MEEIAVDMNTEGLEGEMELPGANRSSKPDALSTLDEPVSATIVWDLWGPLILCMYMAMMLQSTSAITDMHSSDGGPEFATFFLVYWVGAMVITLNTILLGGSISVFQCLCVLGYCVVPLAVALTLCKAMLVVEQTTGLFVVRCLIVLLAFGWSVFASTAFLVDSQPPKRKALVLYPVSLFYFVISWLVISHNGQ